MSRDRLWLLRELSKAIGARRYLEIGVFEGYTFEGLKGFVPERVGVDPNRSSKATVYTTSDRYFAGLPAEERFDLVFIDGLHERAQVARDIRHALERLNRGSVIVVHDCYPPSEAAQQRVGADGTIPGGVWCGDVWRGWLDIRAERPELPMVVWTGDLGCGLILPGYALHLAGRIGPEHAGESWAMHHATRDTILPAISSEADVDWLLERVREGSR